MSKRTYTLIGIALGFLIITLVATRLYLNREAMLERRHHLLCEVLKPGMSKDQALTVLGQVGDFTMSEGDWLGGDIELNIGFTDSKVADKYGDFFSLLFIDNKYQRAYVRRGSDNWEVICDFYQPTESPTRTPIQIP